MTTLDPARLPPLDGEFRTDRAALDAAAVDFGGLVSARPGAVLRPGSVDDVTAVVGLAARDGIPVAARGCGHSCHGQALAPGGIVVELGALSRIGVVEADRVSVGAGATWRAVVEATAPAGLTPPVLTDYLGLSVGGTLAVGGIGGASHRHGLHTDTVVDLDVVTGDGVLRTCSAEHDPDLFRAVLGGLGQAGIVTRAMLRLVARPARVRTYTLSYPSIAALTADQRLLLRERRVDHLQGQVVAGESGWRYLLAAAAFHDPAAEPDDGAVLAGLAHTRGDEVVEDVAYGEFADRLALAEAYQRGTGEWSHPHPWWNAFLPDSTADVLLARLDTELTPADLGASGLMLVYPVFTAPLRTPLVRVPAEPVVFLVAILRYAPPDDPAATDRLVAANRDWYSRARDLGGTRYPVGAIPFAPEDWREHFGAAWPAFAEALGRYDPAGILAPGQGITAR